MINRSENNKPVFEKLSFPRMLMCRSLRYIESKEKSARIFTTPLLVKVGAGLGRDRNNLKCTQAGEIVMK